MRMILVYTLGMDKAPLITSQARQPSHTSDDGRASTGRVGVGRITTEKLLGGLRELEIEHGAEVYRLRVTSTGKLILTK